MALMKINENQEGMKRALVKFSGGIKEPQEILLGPGTCTMDLLEHLGLNKSDFHLSKGSSDSVFGDDEILYPRVNSGDCLFVTSRVDAGV